MSNPLLGETRLALKDGRELVLVLDFEALIEAEAAYAKPMAAMMADALAGFVGASRAVLFGALRAKHPGIGLREAGALLASDGAAVEAALDAASAAAFPQQAEDGDKADPPLATPPAAPRGSSSGRSGAKPGSTRTSFGGRPRKPSS